MYNIIIIIKAKNIEFCRIKNICLKKKRMLLGFYFVFCLQNDDCINLQSHLPRNMQFFYFFVDLLISHNWLNIVSKLVIFTKHIIIFTRFASFNKERIKKILSFFLYIKILILNF